MCLNKKKLLESWLHFRWEEQVKKNKKYKSHRVIICCLVDSSSWFDPSSLFVLIQLFLPLWVHTLCFNESMPSSRCHREYSGHSVVYMDIVTAEGSKWPSIVHRNIDCVSNLVSPALCLVLSVSAPVSLFPQPYDNKFVRYTKSCSLCKCVWLSFLISNVSFKVIWIVLTLIVYIFLVISAQNGPYDHVFMCAFHFKQIIDVCPFFLCAYIRVYLTYFREHHAHLNLRIFCLL